MIDKYLDPSSETIDEYCRRVRKALHPENKQALINKLDDYGIQVDEKRVSFFNFDIPRPYEFDNLKAYRRNWSLESSVVYYSEAMIKQYLIIRCLTLKVIKHFTPVQNNFQSK